MNTKPVSKQTLHKLKSSQRRCFIWKAILKSFCIIQRKTPVLKPPFNKVAALKTSCFIKKKIPTKVFYCEYCKIFKNAYFEKQFQTAVSVHSVSKLEKWEIKNSSKQWPCLWNIQKQLFRGAQKDTNPKYILKFQENVSCKVRHHLKGSWAPVSGYFWWFWQ